MPTDLKSNLWSCGTLDMGLQHMEDQQKNVKMEMEPTKIDDELAVLWWKLLLVRSLIYIYIDKHSHVSKEIPS